MSPIQPRMHQGMPAAYTACLHTEVLSNETRAAAYEDVHHDRDDGIFKQEYLFVGSGFFSRRKRTWYRLFSTKLYSLESPKAAADPSCEMVKVSCDTCPFCFFSLTAFACMGAPPQVMMADIASSTVCERYRMCSSWQPRIDSSCRQLHASG